MFCGGDLVGYGPYPNEVCALIAQRANLAGQLGQLLRVFQEVLSSSGNRRVPVQFLYSNAVHGAEGPIDQPDPPAQR